MWQTIVNQHWGDMIPLKQLFSLHTKEKYDGLDSFCVYHSHNRGL